MTVYARQAQTYSTARPSLDACAGVRNEDSGIQNYCGMATRRQDTERRAEKMNSSVFSLSREA